MLKGNLYNEKGLMAIATVPVILNPNPPEAPVIITDKDGYFEFDIPEGHTFEIGENYLVKNPIIN